MAVPVLAPTFSAVAAPAKFKVVAVVLYNACVVCVPTTVGLPMVNVPLVAPMLNVVAAPPKFKVVAVVLYKACVDCVLSVGGNCSQGLIVCESIAIFGTR